MDEKKPPKVVISDEALKDVPEAEREALKKEILEVFADFDADNPPGRLVEHLQTGGDRCPHCGGKLVVVARNRDWGLEEGPVDIFDCDPCDCSFTAPTIVN